MTTLPALTTTPGLPCRPDPEPWYSDNAADRAWAQRQCAGCPVRVACAAYAIEAREAWGVWGGTTAAERRSFRDGRPWRFDEQGRLRLVCGSVDAYRSHLGYREQPCEACQEAWAAHVLADRRRRLDVEHAKPGGGSVPGYHLHRRLDEPACACCLRALREQSAADRRARAGRRVQRPRAAAVAAGADEGVPGPHGGVQRLAIAS